MVNLLPFLELKSLIVLMLFCLLELIKMDDLSLKLNLLTSILLRELVFKANEARVWSLSVETCIINSKTMETREMFLNIVSTL